MTFALWSVADDPQAADRTLWMPAPRFQKQPHTFLLGKQPCVQEPGADLAVFAGIRKCVGPHADALGWNSQAVDVLSDVRAQCDEAVDAPPGRTGARPGRSPSRSSEQPSRGSTNGRSPESRTVAHDSPCRHGRHGSRCPRHRPGGNCEWCGLPERREHARSARSKATGVDTGCEGEGGRGGSPVSAGQDRPEHSARRLGASEGGVSV